MSNGVVIGMDPQVMDGEERILGGGRYTTDVAGNQAMVKFGQQFEQRTSVGIRVVEPTAGMPRAPLAGNTMTPTVSKMSGRGLAKPLARTPNATPRSGP